MYKTPETSRKNTKQLKPKTPQALFSLQDFPPIGGYPNQGSPTTSYKSEPERPTPRQYKKEVAENKNAAYSNDDSIAEGYGVLTWLSAKGGLICTDDGRRVTFQNESFDKSIENLTLFLRVGFTLKFIAVRTDEHETDLYTATQITPIFGNEAKTVFKDSRGIQFENPICEKESYNLELEIVAYDAILKCFQWAGKSRIHMNSLNNRLNSYFDQRLDGYIHNSTGKRRMFLGKRTHIFIHHSGDSFSLQSPEIYEAVFRLCDYLLHHGGVSSIQSLHDFYLSDEMPSPVRNFIGSELPEFLTLLHSHPFVFATLKNRAYVSVRRNLPMFNYPEYILKVFSSIRMVEQQQDQHERQWTAGQIQGREQIQEHSRAPRQNHEQRHQQSQIQCRVQVQDQEKFYDHREKRHQNVMQELRDFNPFQQNLTQEYAPEMEIWMDRALIDLRVSSGPRRMAPEHLDAEAQRAPTSQCNVIQPPIGRKMCICKCSCEHKKTGQVVQLPTVLPDVGNLAETRPLSSELASNALIESLPAYSLFGPYFRENYFQGILDSLGYHSYL